jgi:carboxylate-amine ligase
VWLRGTHGRRQVDVVYRRTDVDRLAGPDGRLTALGELLLEPLRGGTVACVNAFGNGVADDKLVQAYVEEMIRFYLGEEPLLPSVPTYDLNDPEVRECVLDRLDEVVVKPRDGHGGTGVCIGPRCTPAALEAVADEICACPEAWVAQETVALSTHPTVCGGRLSPRHVDLRPFAYSTPRGVRVLAGGLTRVALREGSLIVNSSQDGGAKDTWVLAE